MRTKPKFGVKIRLIRRFRELCNIEFTHQIKVCYYLKANKADCIEP